MPRLSLIILALVLAGCAGMYVAGDAGANAGSTNAPPQRTP